jgi:predicted enzyme related to lactoylglutathione lyase
VCKLRGREAAGVGPQPSADVAPAWNTHVPVESIDDVAAKAIEAGGERVATISDPAGAVFCVSEPGAHPGA